MMTACLLPGAGRGRVRFVSQSFSYPRRVHFAETDAAGIAHFAAILCWVEEAEHALWASLGFAVHPASAGNLSAPVGWPRAGLEVRYRAPVRLDEELEVRLSLREWRGSRLVWDFQIVGADLLRAEGSLTVVSVTARGGSFATVPVPEEMLTGLRGSGYLTD